MRPDHCTFTDEAFPHVVRCGETCSDPCPKHVGTTYVGEVLADGSVGNFKPKEES